MLPQRRRPDNTSATIASDAVVCEEATLQGDITIGPRSVVHPKAIIIAKDGPVVIGEGNLIEEQSRIINRNPPGMEGSTPLVIGNNNVFEVGSEFEGKFVGNSNVLEAKASVGVCTKLTNGCVIGAMCHVNIDETLPENTIICGDQYLRRINHEKPQVFNDVVGCFDESPSLFSCSSETYCRTACPVFPEERLIWFNGSRTSERLHRIINIKTAHSINSFWDSS